MIKNLTNYSLRKQTLKISQELNTELGSRFIILKEKTGLVGCMPGCVCVCVFVRSWFCFFALFLLSQVSFYFT